MYHALYRKYRPLYFNSVVGQSSIVKTLKNSIVNNKFSHAYMFFGPRGTGKTTLSKIFARSVNCLNPKDGEACGKCDACLNSFSNDCIDIIEIDAASNNGVDEIRELRNKISLVPSQLKYKVYIIDEVHMLSIGAFNALLKTLEEPPEHAIFILATTDSQKVPETIVSRCQCFSFKRVSNESIVERLKYVCSEEQIAIDDDVINKIAILSDGGMRDALGYLDKMVSFSDKKITIEDFNEVNGIISDDDVESFLNYILKGSIEKVLTIINDFNDSGKNLIQIMVQLIDYIRNIIVDYYLKNNSLNYSIDLYQALINNLNDKIVSIKKSDNAKIYIEMLLLKFINDNIINENIISNNNYKPVDKGNFIQNNTIVEKKSSDEKQIEMNKNSLIKDENDAKNVIMESQEKYNSIELDEEKSLIINIDDVMQARINNAFATASKQTLKEINSSFDKLKDYTFDQDIGFLVCSLLDSTVRVAGNSVFIISYNSDALVKSNLNNLLKLEDTYNKLNNSHFKIAIISDDDWDILKNQYITNLKNNISYNLMEEPELVFEESNKNDIISSSAVELFGSDIVEVE